MFKHVLIILAGVLLGLTLAWAAGARDLDPAEGVYRLVVLDARGVPIATGTGFAVNPTTIVTAGHVVAGGAAFLVGDERSGVPGAYDVLGIVDVGVVVVSRPLPAPYRRLDCRRPARGEPVIAAGYPLDVDLGEWRGHVASDRPPQTGFVGAPHLVILDLSVSPGLSGGPVSDADNDVVGLVSAAVTQPVLGDDRVFAVSGTSLAVAGDALCVFLRAVGIDYHER